MKQIQFKLLKPQFKLQPAVFHYGVLVHTGARGFLQQTQHGWILAGCEFTNAGQSCYCDINELASDLAQNVRLFKFSTAVELQQWLGDMNTCVTVEEKGVFDAEKAGELTEQIDPETFIYAYRKPDKTCGLVMRNPFTRDSTFAWIAVPAYKLDTLEAVDYETRCERLIISLLRRGYTVYQHTNYNELFSWFAHSNV